MRADSEKPRWTGEPGPAAPRWQAEQEGLTEGETETQDLTVDYGGCHGGRNSQSHMRVHWKVG